MMLIGQYDSPFVRRVGVALTLYGLAFEHQPWSTFGDADKIAAYNPLRRVPTLVLDDGQVLVDSFAILETLDEMVGPERAMLPRSGPDRREGLRVCALAAGIADKGVALVYEGALREQQLPLWVERCRAQIGGALAQLEAERAARPVRYWFGDGISHADVLLTTMQRFLNEALDGAIPMDAYPALRAHAQRCEALDAFQAILQPYSLAPPPEQ
jgi:glutathione S-transferase